VEAVAGAAVAVGLVQARRTRRSPCRPPRSASPPTRLPRRRPSAPAVPASSASRPRPHRR
jgi:hypothetical protein